MGKRQPTPSPALGLKRLPAPSLRFPRLKRNHPSALLLKRLRKSPKRGFQSVVRKLLSLPPRRIHFFRPRLPLLRRNRHLVRQPRHLPLHSPRKALSRLQLKRRRLSPLLQPQQRIHFPVPLPSQRFAWSPSPSPLSSQPAGKSPHLLLSSSPEAPLPPRVLDSPVHQPNRRLRVGIPPVSLSSAPSSGSKGK